MASDTDYPDGDYIYPLGLTDFCFTTESASEDVVIIYVTDLKASQVTARKYNTTTNQYADVPGAVITETTYGGQPALRLAYTIADNGPLDTNDTLGVIDDPVGLATTPDTTDTSVETGVGVPNTGLKAQDMGLFVLSAIASLGLFSVLILDRQKR